MERISYLLGSVQRSLFPYLREEIGDLTEKERRFVLVLEVVEVEKHVRKAHWRGRKPKDRPDLSGPALSWLKLSTTSRRPRHCWRV